MDTVGILLAGGTASRLYPITLYTNKHLLPVYDKPLIYYPLVTLLQLGIKDILVVTTKEDLNLIKLQLKDGKQWGISITYLIQDAPLGIAHALSISSYFYNKAKRVILILGDNLFISTSLVNQLNYIEDVGIILTEVTEPQHYGVMDFSNNLLIEKPLEPPSDWIATGIYSFPVSKLSINLNKLVISSRNQYEITDLINLYSGDINLVALAPDDIWVDVGTPDRLHDASSIIELLQSKGFYIGFPELESVKCGYQTLEKIIEYLGITYGKDNHYTQTVIKEIEYVTK